MGPLSITWSRASSDDDGTTNGVDDDGIVEPHLICHEFSIPLSSQDPTFSSIKTTKNIKTKSLSNQ